MGEPFMVSFVKAASEGATEALLRYLGDKRWISEVLIAAIHNIFTFDTLLKLLDRKHDRAPVSENVLFALVTREYPRRSDEETLQGRLIETMGTLLDDCGSVLMISERIILAVLKINNYGIEDEAAALLLRMFLSQQQAGFTVTEKILQEAAV